MSDELCIQIKNKIESLLQADTSRKVITYTDPLVSSGLLNSLKIVELASWLESDYGVDFSVNGFNVYDFETIETIVSLINKSLFFKRG